MRRPLPLRHDVGVATLTRFRADGRVFDEAVARYFGPDLLFSAYVASGDWPAGLALAACVLLAVVGWRARRPAQSARPA